ncbi:hypothetical protein Naga_100220g7 [Nannochloropsis gaditana]|uniref:Uncharacterized protein n=1 Tax=Nannochloropsis gaditana TaxID=72520 RepID=W7TNI6_9STRA|nr:hypothetical protein Naga_100220g7 [Nannochloropsis gaditana]
MLASSQWIFYSYAKKRRTWSKAVSYIVVSSKQKFMYLNIEQRVVPRLNHEISLVKCLMFSKQNEAARKCTAFFHSLIY